MLWEKAYEELRSINVMLHYSVDLLTLNTGEHTRRGSHAHPSFQDRPVFVRYSKLVWPRCLTRETLLEYVAVEVGLAVRLWLPPLLRSGKHENSASRDLRLCWPEPELEREKPYVMRNRPEGYIFVVS